MASELAAQAMEDPVTWESARESIVTCVDSNFSLEQCQNPGLASFPQEDLDFIRRLFSMLLWLQNVMVNCAADFDKPAFMAVCRDARQIFLESDLPDDEVPFRPLEKKVSSEAVKRALKAPGGFLCAADWGPVDGPVRNLLSPAAMTLLVWLGPRFAKPLLDLTFAFSTNYKSFTLAMLACPVRTDLLGLLGVRERTTKLRTTPAVNSHGAALIKLVKASEPKVFNIVHAVWHAFTSARYCLKSVSEVFPTVHVSEITKAEAQQYRDCSASVTTQVQSILPIHSSLPESNPNFLDDNSNTWFRSAQYTFSSVHMPTAAALRGDPLSELRWHKYQSDVLHARANCLQLSEKQVIQHLTTTFSRTDQHVTVAQEAALNPECTVRQWLEVIRDFYFTSGQFRHNIEHAWQRYDAADSADFNELMHHIKTYYRLIFLDYTHMQGKQCKVDFACILFTKLQRLMQPTCKSTLADTLRMFLPMSTLLEKFNLELKPLVGLSTFQADATAVKFTTWAVTQLQQVRESANTVKRYTGDAPDSKIDYAMLVSKRKSQAPGTHEPKQQAAAAILPGPPANNRNGLQKRAAPSGPLPGTRQPLIPQLKEQANSTDEDTFRPWLQGFVQNPVVPADLRKALSLELEGGPTSVHGALAAATHPLPPGIEPTFMFTATRMLRMHYLYPFKQCWLCPSARNNANPQAGHHQVDHCPTFLSLVPQASRDAFFGEAFNRRHNLTPLPQRYNPTRHRDRDNKRDRCEPNRRGSDTQAKRSRPDHHHHVR